MICGDFNTPLDTTVQRVVCVLFLLNVVNLNTCKNPLTYFFMHLHKSPAKHGMKHKVSFWIESFPGTKNI